MGTTDRVMRPAKQLRTALLVGLEGYGRMGFVPRVKIRRQYPQQGWTTITATLWCGRVPLDQFMATWCHDGDEELHLAGFLILREVEALALRVQRRVDLAVARMVQRRGG